MKLKEQLEKYRDEKYPKNNLYDHTGDHRKSFNDCLELLLPLVEACQEINEWRVGDNPASKALQELREKLK